MNNSSGDESPLKKNKKQKGSNTSRDNTLDEWLKVVCGHSELQAELPHIQ